MLDLRERPYLRLSFHHQVWEEKVENNSRDVKPSSTIQDIEGEVKHLLQ